MQVCIISLTEIYPFVQGHDQHGNHGQTPGRCHHCKCGCRWDGRTGCSDCMCAGRQIEEGVTRQHPTTAEKEQVLSFWPGVGV